MNVLRGSLHLPAPLHGQRRPTALALSFGLIAVGIGCFVAGQALIATGPPAAARGKGFFAEPLPASLMLCAAASLIGGGAVAALGLWRERLVSRRGRIAEALAIASIALLPLLGVIQALAGLAGVHLEEGWGQPIVPVWLVAMVISVLLGAVAPERGRRGLLITPLLIGAVVLTFCLGEVLSPH